MKLDEYIDKYSPYSIEQFMKLGGFSRTSLYVWMYKNVKPSRKYARKIEEITEGMVTFDEMRGIKNGK